MTVGEVIALIKAFGGGGGGSSGGVLVVHETTVDGVSTLDKTWQEIHDADFAVISILDDGTRIFEPVYMAAQDSDTSFTVRTYDDVDYTTDSASGYPSI